VLVHHSASPTLPATQVGVFSLANWPSAARTLQPEWRETLEKRYGAQAPSIQHAEAFEITEYGHQPSEDEIRKLFPFFPDR